MTFQTMGMMMNSNQIQALRDAYHRELLDDNIPFWMKHSIDREAGGYLFCLDREGAVFDTDKPMWVQGRFVWLLSTLYRTVEKKAEWLDAATHGVEFLQRHGFDDDGRMFFVVTREGEPIRKRRYLFTECFAVIAYSAYGRITDDTAVLDKAVALFELIIRYYTTPGLLPAKTVPGIRDSRGIGMPMMLLTVAQELYDATGNDLAKQWIDRAIDEMVTYHVKCDPYRVLETVGPKGEYIDHTGGRCITPGHIIEAGWFVLDEARRRGGDSTLVAEGTAMIDWAFDLGWDDEFGGILYYRDIAGRPPTEYWHDMKFWWQHNEAIIAGLLAWHLTGDAKYLDMHNKVRDWSYKYFPDPEFGEWYGYLRRDGAVSTTLKGNLWKGPFHLPRMLMYCYQLLDEVSRTHG